ncbi:hypothetical protein ACFL6W_09470 [Thermodesulfobacteriota bacterium]
MKKFFISGAVLFLVFLNTTAYASGPSTISDTVSISQKVSAFAGNVVITFEKGKDVKINAAKMVRNENKFILKGNVEIKFNNLVFHTEKAAILTSDDKVLIKMKSCEIKNT